MIPTIEAAISNFGRTAKLKLSNPAVTGQPEDQLRAPFEQLLEDLSTLCGFRAGTVVAPGKGANPPRFRDPHDKAQWEKLSSLPNLLYTDGNSFSLWQDGKLVGSVLTLKGDIDTSGPKLAPAPGLLPLFESFLRWRPVAPRSARELAHTTARLCGFLRDEVTELAVSLAGLTTSTGRFGNSMIGSSAISWSA